MRNVSAGIVSAITDNPSYSLYVNAEIETTRLGTLSPLNSATEEFDFDDPPVAEDITYISSESLGVVTFYNSSGSSGINGKITYQKTQSATVVDTNIDCYGKSGSYGESLWRRYGNNLYYHTIDPAKIAALQSDAIGSGASIYSSFDSSFEASTFHAIASDEVVHLYFKDNLVKVQLFDEVGTCTDLGCVDDKFTFLTEEPLLSTAKFTILQHSCAVRLDDCIFIYLSNPVTGEVLGYRYNTVTGGVSSTRVVVPTDLQVSQCVFRPTSCFERNSVICMVGMFSRTDAVSEAHYTLLLRSTDGLSFSLDRFTYLSVLSKRFLARVNGNTLYLSGKNEVYSSTLSPLLSSGSYSTLSIPASRIISFADKDLEQATLSIAVGDEQLLYSSYITIGNLVRVSAGYITSSGSDPEYATYGTYIVSGITRSVSQGVRVATLTLTNKVMWFLQGMNSPYYSEIVSNTSTHVTFSTSSDLGYFSPASNGMISIDNFSVDFWEHEGYADATAGITEALSTSSIGVDMFAASAGTKKGIRTKSLSTITSFSGYPTLSSGSCNIELYGWAFKDSTTGSDNGTVEIRMYLRSASGTDYYVSSGSTNKFPCTYPETAGGTYPISCTLVGQPNEKILYFAVIFHASVAIKFYVHRIDVTSGVSANMYYMSNSPWKFEDADGGYIKVPGYFRPFVMLSNKPYTARDFISAAEFSLTASNMVSGYPVACGLVGSAVDTKNAMVGRYNETNQNLEILKLTDGIETVMSSGSVSMPERFWLMFLSIGNSYKLFWKEHTSDEWIFGTDVDYANDMITSNVGELISSPFLSLHTGIYGIIRSPFFATTGLKAATNDEDSVASEGIPMLPGYSEFADFPDSGQVAINDSIYSYTAKLTVADYIRGPSQFRNCGLYASPYGDGYGLECRDFDKTKTSSYLSTKFCAIDDGSAYIIDHTKWDVWITTDGAVVQLPGRARYYAGLLSGTTKHSLTNRVYATSGIFNIAHIDGPSVARHSFGSLCRYYVDADIKCYRYYSTSISTDNTVMTLIDRVARYSGADVIFSGNSSGSYTLSPSTGWKVGDIPYATGFELYFDMPASDNDAWLSVYSSNITSGSYDVETRYVQSSSSTASIYLIDNATGSTLDRSFQFSNTPAGVTKRFRIVYHDNFATWYMNDKWLYTHHLSDMDYANSMSVYLMSNKSLTLENIVFVELSDWREAIYIDLETDGMSAISTIVQERPVEIHAKSDGSVAVWYDKYVGDIVSQPSTIIRRHDWKDQLPTNASSDAIVYGDNVNTIQYAPYLVSFGLSTKMYRTPNLSSGAMRAAYMLLHKYHEQKKMHTLTTRPDIRIEPGDRLNITYDSPGSGTSISFSVVVESVSLSFEASSLESTMNIVGREIVE